MSVLTENRDCLTFRIVFIKEVFEKVNFEKSADSNKSMKNYSVCKELQCYALLITDPTEFPLDFSSLVYAVFQQKFHRNPVDIISMEFSGENWWYSSGCSTVYHRNPVEIPLDYCSEIKWYSSASSTAGIPQKSSGNSFGLLQ